MTSELFLHAFNWFQSKGEETWRTINLLEGIGHLVFYFERLAQVLDFHKAICLHVCFKYLQSKLHWLTLPKTTINCYSEKKTMVTQWWKITLLCAVIFSGFNFCYYFGNGMIHIVENTPDRLMITDNYSCVRLGPLHIYHTAEVHLFWFRQQMGP